MYWRLASISEGEFFPDSGGLVAYGGDSFNQFQLAASLAVKILMGATPAALDSSARPLHNPPREKNRLPTIHWWLSAGDTGGLTAYGIEQDLSFRKAGWLCGEDPEVANPCDLPVERLYDYKLHLNKRAAKAIGLTLPDAVLLRAEKVRLARAI